MSRDMENKTLDLWAKKLTCEKKEWNRGSSSLAEGELITLSIRADRISTN